VSLGASSGDDFRGSSMLGGSIAYIPALIFLAALLIFAWWRDKRPKGD
jgi:hypothetical protein